MFFHWQSLVRGSTERKQYENLDVGGMIKVFLQRQRRRQKFGFDGYLESMKESMLKNGFAEYWCAFDEDVQKQDKLATWFEYAFFAHCYVERFEVLLRLLQPTYNEA